METIKQEKVPKSITAGIGARENRVVLITHELEGLSAIIDSLKEGCPQSYSVGDESMLNAWERMGRNDAQRNRVPEPKATIHNTMTLFGLECIRSYLRAWVKEYNAETERQQSILLEASGTETSCPEASSGDGKTDKAAEGCTDGTESRKNGPEKKNQLDGGTGGLGQCNQTQAAPARNKKRNSRRA